MILSSFSYKTTGWELVEMNALNLTNLLVGKNASGKTRTIKALQNVTSFLYFQPANFGGYSFKTKLSFADPNNKDWIMTYSFEIIDGKVKTENLLVCGKAILKRDSSKSVLRDVIIYPPKEKLIIQVRRDSMDYPEIEKLMNWAEGVVVVSCSDINSYTILNKTAGFINPLPFSELVNRLSAEEIKHVMSDAKLLGYDITDMKPVEVNSELKLVAVKERYVVGRLVDFQLSSGMLRVLYLLCILEFCKHGNISLLLIDDLGEGLDYKRAIHLGQKVFDTCDENGIQMIASSNDSCLMDVIDISKWQLLRRNYSKLSVLNQSNNPELFNQFRLTGLSNFDLFSSDFIDNFFASLQK